MKIMKSLFMYVISFIVFTIILAFAYIAGQKNTIKMFNDQITLINKRTDEINYQKKLLDKLYVQYNQTKHNMDWELMKLAVIAVESENNPQAINSATNAVGLYQIRPILVYDCNRILGENKYSLNDRYNAVKSHEMFEVIQRHYNKLHNVKTAVNIQIQGATGYKKNGNCNWYVKRVFAKMNEIKDQYENHR